MMRTILLFFCAIATCLPFEAKAQLWPIGTTWLYWQQDYTPWSPDNDFRLFEITKDSVVQGVNYQILSEWYALEQADTLQRFQRKQWLIKQTGNKVEVLDATTGLLYPFYDFDAQIGDTLETIKYASPTDLITYHIDSMSIDAASSITKWHVTVTPWSDHGIFRPILKGIGGYEFLFSSPGFVDPPPGGSLVCFKNPQGTNFGSTCTLLSTTQGAQELSKALAYPNPLQSNQISLTGVVADSWSLYSSSGALLGSGAFTEHLTLPLVLPGSYALICVKDNKAVYYQKLIYIGN